MVCTHTDEKYKQRQEKRYAQTRGVHVHLMITRIVYFVSGINHTELHNEHYLSLLKSFAAKECLPHIIIFRFILKRIITQQQSFKHIENTWQIKSKKL